MINEPPLRSLIEADERALEEIYVGYRSAFINYARKFQLSDDEILDVYQDSIIALRENILNGKVVELNSSIKTYLFSIGKYKIYAGLREKNKMQVIEDYNVPEEKEIGFEMNPDPLNDRQSILKAALQKMGGKCKLILELFYYRGFTIDEIRVSENYENNNTVKSQKSRCLRKLKEMINLEK